MSVRNVATILVLYGGGLAVGGLRQSETLPWWGGLIASAVIGVVFMALQEIKK